MEAMIPEKFYTKKEVATTLRVSIVTIGRLMKTKQISYCKVSKQPRFTKSDIQAYLKKTKENAYDYQIEHSTITKEGILEVTSTKNLGEPDIISRGEHNHKEKK